MVTDSILFLLIYEYAVLITKLISASIGLMHEPLVKMSKF